jgi:hypothetical protein
MEITALEVFNDVFLWQNLYKIYYNLNCKQNKIVNSKVFIKLFAFSVFLSIFDKCVLIYVDEQHWAKHAKIIYLLTK